MTARRHRRPTGRLATLAAALVAWTSASPTANGQAIDQQVRNDRPKFLVRVSVDKKYRIYAEGEALTLKVRCEEDAYLYVLYQQADGQLFQIFPNRGQPDNRIKGMQDVQVPAADDGFRWVVGPPLGVEVVKVIASKKPVDALSLPGLKEDRFNPVTVEQVQGAGQQLAKEPDNVWSEHDLKIKTVRRGEPTEPASARKRVGVFFGVSEYEFSPITEQLTGGKWKLNLNKPHHDAEDMARLLKSVGGLSDARVVLNREVTRDKMRELITEWLPSVTAPGDTAIIFFSGHGDQIADDGKDEADGRDETIDTTEMITLPIMNELMARNRKGELAPDLSARVSRLEAAAGQVYERALAAAGGQGATGAKDRASQQVGAFLVRSTAVGDDEMGHWVQKLDGRRVLVLLDSCHSGGLNPTGAPTDKGLSARRAAPAGFDFLGGEFARLKDLDQPSLTVLAAASEPESSVERGRDRNGLFTGALVGLLEKAGGPVDVRQALDHARVEIKEKLAEANKARAQHNSSLPPGQEKLEMVQDFVPQLFTTDPQPVYLKPPAPSPTDADLVSPERRSR